MPMEQASRHCDKDTLKMAMLKHEETFRQQVHELHRLYRIQKLLMRDLTRELKLKSQRSLPTTSPNGSAPLSASTSWRQSSSTCGARHAVSQDEAGDRAGRGAGGGRRRGAAAAAVPLAQPQDGMTRCEEARAHCMCVRCCLLCQGVDLLLFFS
ncbi:hypothetical protein ZEAMMB73_Zm00001d013216 [Zea mays]|uniref:Uncharacterized protein n=1 Tax=Zea mays TaxID=4577 RepID=A0A1D6GGK7_MAIZE|nr:hypothetical protein ZEAMMB73_Zm00001d013216 [Zea mays]